MDTQRFFCRDKSMSKVNMAMNYISRVIRENLVLFDYDASTSEASFLSESNRLISGNIVEENGSLFVKNIEINEASDLFSNESIDEKVNVSVKSFIQSLREDSYVSAQSSFDDLLGAFESRSKVNEMRSKLEKKVSCFSETNNILNTPEFNKLVEVRDALVRYLENEKETISESSDVYNALKLSMILGKTFNTPRKTFEEIHGTSIEVPYDEQKTVFETLCSQELVRNELNESKENFSRSWIKNSKINKLASCIYHDDSTIYTALSEAIKDVPYLALASKSDIKSIFASVYESSDIGNITQKDIREFVAKIFEFKKPIKQDIIAELNESYGINIQNLKFIPTFSNLAKTQAALFESLAIISETESVAKDVFENFSKVLSKKGGIETLDVNEFICDILSDVGIRVTEKAFQTADLNEVVEAVLENKDKGYPEKNIKGGTKAAEREEMRRKKSKKGAVETEDDEQEVDEAKDLPGNQEKLDVDKDGKIEGEDLAKLRKGKKKKSMKGKDEKEMPDESERADEAAEGDDEDDVEVGLGDSQMTELMAELENLFKEIDWDALAQEDDEDDTDEEEPQSSM